MEFELGAWRELRPGVHAAKAEPAGVNVGLVVGTESALVIDCGSSPDHGRQIAASAEALTGRPISHVVVTHDHWDHFWGLAGVSHGRDVVSIAHESVVPQTDDEARDHARVLGFELDDLVAPNNPISLVKAFDLGGRRVEVLHLGPAHTQGDVIVLVPDARVAFAGDIFETSGPPSFGPESRVDTWPSVLDGVLAGAQDDALIVPGHGEPTPRFEAFQQRADISMIHGSVERLVARGIRLEQALAALDSPLGADGSPHPGASEWEWPFDVATIKAALPLSYAQLAAKGVVPRTSLRLV